MMRPGAQTVPEIRITGLGWVTPLGHDRASVTSHLREGRHGLSPVTYLDNPDLPVKLAGLPKGFEVDSPSWRNWSWPGDCAIPRETLRGLAPHGVYAFFALSQALRDAGLRPTDYEHDADTGLFCASAGSPRMLHHNLGQMMNVKGSRGNPLGLVSSIAGTLNFTLAAHFHITGAVCGFVSACASSSHALGYALDELRLGRLQRAVVVGAEEITAETVLPFMAMNAISPESDPMRASRPFDADRNGFVGAGGAVALVLEAEPLARARGVRGYAELAGWGQSADGYSIATSHPEGEGLERAMRKTLADAGAAPGEVDYVNAHATSTPVGDRAEAKALARVFFGAGHRPAISGTKGLTGHPLSMSGVMEAAICSLALADGFIPGNAHLVNPDSACEGLDLPRETLARSPSLTLTNSSEFGGSNVCHLLKRIV